MPEPGLYVMAGIVCFRVAIVCLVAAMATGLAEMLGRLRARRRT
ncbi:hypothetical protein AB0F46_35295 [Streptomyces sp. NPDC026665]